MNEGFDFNRPPDNDASDPLLAALRQRLGPSFGEEPPPGLWAGIQQQLPGTKPRPWWRRPQRLLPLLAVLASLLLLGVVTTRRLSERPGSGSLATRFPASLPTPGAANPGSRPQLPTQYTDNKAQSKESNVSNTLPSSASSTSTTIASSVPTKTAHPATTPSLVTAAGIAARPARRHPRPVGAARFAAASSAKLRLSAAHRPTDRAGRPVPAGSNKAAPGTAAVRPARLARQLGHAAGAVATTLPTRPIESGAAAPTRREATLAALAYSARRPARQLAATTRTASKHKSFISRDLLPAPALRKSLGDGATLATNRRAQAALPAQSATSALAGTGAIANPTAPPALLALRRTTLPVLAAGLPPAPVAAPDSAWPWVLPVRRWSVLVVAGPAVSYRTLQPATIATTVIPTVGTPNSSLLPGTQNGSVSTLERPAMGLGAQVQVRRVLSGRWALALGLGYQEYASRLALQVAYYRQSSVANMSQPDSTRLVNQRDTYRLLTLPVQLSYALGPPHGRLALGVLAGVEPGLYVGGRTTENSGCNCQQQVFTSATGSPYNQFNVGVSLGLDVRYRLGSPASRWQLLVQPTGRYVATPFVRTTALGYASRQPYSLGLLTGFAWSWR